MMIKDYKVLIELLHIHMEQMILKYVKVRCWVNMINFDDYVNENKTEHNVKRSYIPDHPYRILILGGSGSGKANALLNLTI